MRIQLNRGYRGKASNEQYLAQGIHDVPDKLAKYLIDFGIAIEVVTTEIATQEPIDDQSEVEEKLPAEQKPRRGRRTKSETSE